MTRRQLGDALRVLLRETRMDMEQAADGLIRMHIEAGEVATNDARCWEVLVQMAKDRGITVKKLRQRNRHPVMTAMRQEAAWLCRQMQPPPSYPTIARALGCRNHTSALYAVRKWQARLDAARGAERTGATGP